jgi:putative transposase
MLQQRYSHVMEKLMPMGRVLTSLLWLKGCCLDALSSRLARWTKPLRTSLPLATLTDLGKSKSQLIAENALLRQQLIILNRQVKRPAVTRTDRILLVLLVRLVRTWRQALLIVQPDTLMRWHRELFRLVWRHKSKTHAHKPKVAPETIALIRQMARENRRLRCRADSWSTAETGHSCVEAHHPEVYETRSLTAATRPDVVDLCAQSRRTDLGVRRAFWSPISSFDRSLRSSSSNRRSRKVIHVGVTGSPTDAWVAQQLREATPYGQAPKYLIRENDGKFGPCFARVATTSGIEILKTPYHAPQANAICERYLRSVRQECLDHLLIFSEKQHEPRAL